MYNIAVVSPRNSPNLPKGNGHPFLNPLTKRLCCVENDSFHFREFVTMFCQSLTEIRKGEMASAGAEGASVDEVGLSAEGVCLP